MNSFSRQLWAMLVQNIKVEWSNSERWISPLLFATTMLLLFSFAIGRLDDEVIAKVFVAETFLTALFALQLSLSRTLEPDTQDRVFELLRTYPLAPTAWFLSKYLLVLLTGGLIVMPTILLSSFFHAESGVSLLHGPVFIVALLVIASLGSLGVLLSTMTMRAGSRQILYPILYFPLTVPVLLSAVESSKAIIINQRSIAELMSSWLGLLIIFGIIYLTLGLLLFSELVKPE
ncbi:MAG: heme exporter protein CcmB [Oligoflexus sp.]